MDEFFDAEEDLGTVPTTVTPIIRVEADSSSNHSSASSAEHNQKSAFDDTDDSTDGGGVESYSLSKREKARRLGTKTKVKAKQLLGLDGLRNEGAQSPTVAAATRVENDPAFNPARLLRQTSASARHAIPATMKESAVNVANVPYATTHPAATARDFFKRRAAKRMSRTQRPFLTAEDDKELLEVYDDLASDSRSPSGEYSLSDSQSEEVEKKRERKDRVESHRESLRIAWAVSRHVDRARVVKHDIPFPRKDMFYEKAETGAVVRWKWEEYLAKLVLYYTRGFTAQYIDDFNELPFDTDTLTRTVERLIMASAPWQAYLVGLRQLYRWENPRRTGIWLIIWVLLWQSQYCGTFFWAYIIYHVLKERYYPTSIENLRDSLHRTIDRSQKAHAWSELMDKHGQKNWIEPLLEDVGPELQLHVTDLADFLEVLINFYHWRRPKQTAATVFFYFCCFLVALICDMDFCVRIVFFVGICSFFLCWPISSRCPKYRFLVNPLRWIYWDIPEHATLSLQDIHKRAHLEKIEVNDSTATYDAVDGAADKAVSQSEDFADGTGDREVTGIATEDFRFQVMSHGKVGRLRLSRASISFTGFGKGSWSVEYDQLVEMRKEEANTTTRTLSLGQAKRAIVFIYLDDGKQLERRVESDTEKRDQIFSIVLGWSGQYWKPYRAANRSKGAKI